MINKTQLRDLIVRATGAIGLQHPAATNLLLGTAAQESRMGHYMRQLYGGPALGILQMEPATFEYHVKYLNKRPELKAAILQFCGVTELRAEYLEFNNAFAICMSRVHYYRIRKALPQAHDIAGLAKYWKIYYNSILGKGTEKEFIENYHKYIL